MFLPVPTLAVDKITETHFAGALHVPKRVPVVLFTASYAQITTRKAGRNVDF